MAIMQTNPDMFTKRFPVHTVTAIDGRAGTVVLNGSDGLSVTVALNSWGNTPDTWPVVGSQIQILPDQE